MRAVIFRECENGRQFRLEVDLPFLPNKGLMIQPRKHGTVVTVSGVKYVCEDGALLVFTEGRATDSDVSLMLKEGRWVREVY